MPLIRIYGARSDVARVVRSLSDNPGIETECRVMARELTCAIELLPPDSHPFATVVRLELRRSRSLARRVHWPMMFALILVAAALLIVEFALTPLLLGIALALLGLISAAVAFRYERMTHLRSHELAKGVVAALEHAGRCEIDGPLRHHMTGFDRLALAAGLGAMISLPIIASIRVGIVAGVLLAVAALFVTTCAIARARLFRTWRSAVLNLQECWTAWCVDAIVLAALVSIAGVLLFGASQGTQASAFADFDRAINEQTRAFFGASHSARRDLSVFADSVHDGLARRFRSNDGVAHLNWSLAMLVIALLGTGAAQLTKSVIYAARALQQWRQLRLHDTQRFFVQPSLPDPGVGSGDTFAVWSFAIVCGTAHWLSVVVAVDVMACCFAGRAFLLPPLSAALELLSHGATMGLGAFWGVLAFAGLAAMIAAPGLVTGTLGGVRLIAWLASEAHINIGRGQVPRATRNWLEHVSRRLHIAVPSVVTTRSGQPAQARASVVTRRAQIRVRSDVWRSLSNDALKAIVAHESWHLRADATNIQRWRIASVLCLCPFSLLSVLCDVARCERQADDFAAEVVGNPGAVIEGLLALHTLENRELGGSANRHRWPTWWRNLHTLTMGDGILGAAYPPLLDRVQWLRSRTRWQQSEGKA